MELEEAKEQLKGILSFYDDYKKDYEEGHTSVYEIQMEDFKAIETVLQELDNSISKDKVKEKIERLKRDYNAFTRIYGRGVISKEQQELLNQIVILQGLLKEK